MASLTRVGFVGIDETVPVARLVEVSKTYPHVELGLCLAYQGTPTQPVACFDDGADQSAWPQAVTAWWTKVGPRVYENNGKRRMYGYPGWSYMKELKDSGKDLRLSLHLNNGDQALGICNYVTGFVDGEDWVVSFLKWFAEGCDFLRVQLNITSRGIPLKEYDEAPDQRAANIVNIMKQLGKTVQLVIPFKEKPGRFVEAILSKAKEEGIQECFSLFNDPSAGSGTEGSNLFDPDSLGADLFSKAQWVGYAGGLSQENCVEKATIMSAAAKGHPCWTDMQTNVRQPTKLVAKPEDPVPEEPRRNRYFGNVDVAVMETVAKAIQAAL